jgi:signal peptidase I
MTEVTISSKKIRRPWLAIVLSLIVPGLGHLYCGRIVRGLIMAFLFGLFGNMIWVSVVFLSPLKAAFFCMFLLAYFTLWLMPAVDSYIIARHTKSDYELKDYNRLIVYFLWAVMSSGSSVIGSLHFREKFLEAFRVPAASSYPTIVPGDRFLANKLAYKKNDPRRGDLIVFMNPESRQEKLVKRVVALAGDSVEIRDNELYINDVKLERHRLPDSALDRIRIEIRGKLLEGDLYEEVNNGVRYDIFLGRPSLNHSPDFAKITVLPNHCFVLGDNRNLSRDSRHFGPIPLAMITGRADFIYWPAKDISRFGSLGSE